MSRGTEPLPVGFGIALDPGARAHADGCVLIGGAPRRILRLAPAGAAAVADLVAGRPVGPAGRALGRRLVDAGVAHPVPPAGAGDPADVTVVVPVRDRPAPLRRCLDALAGHPHVLVVDDGSTDPAAVRAAAEVVGARVVRRDVAGGPGVARNAALPHLRTPLVAFLDSDCVPPPGWLGPLVAHLDDPAVAAVAPRVRGRAGGGAGVAAPGGAARPVPTQAAGPAGASTVARWGAARSPLDLGPRPARVAPGTAVAYVPTAALVVRRSVLGDGFDPALRHGEDVDLVWRLHDRGLRLRYEPSVVVDHDEPAAAGAFLRRRRDYGASAGPLARRHGARLAPVVLPPRPTLAAGLLLARRPRAAALVLLGEVVRTERALAGPGVPRGTGARAALRTAWSTVDGLSRGATVLAAPAVLGLALARPAARGPIAGLVLAGPVAEWVRARRDQRTGGLDPARWILCRLADDAAYGSGVWRGAVRARAPRALLPLVPRGGPGA